MSKKDDIATQSDLNALASGVAVLATCIVKTLDETNAGFQGRFLEYLAAAYRQRRDEADLRELEVLNWTRQLLTGFSPIAGQGEPFFRD